ncbi:MAG: DNA-binding protein [Solibacillus sp.]
MINLEFDMRVFRDEIREVVREVIREESKQEMSKPTLQVQTLPPFLTRDELKQLLHIGDTKAAELLKRRDFPVLRQAGVLIPSHLFIKWVEANTEWIALNAKLYKSIS